MNDTIATDSPFSIEEQSTLRVLVGMIVPENTEFDVPGADDELIFADILSSARANEQPIRQGIHFARALAVEKELAQATAELEGRPELAPLVGLVMQCYYRDDRVMTSLGMEARAPFPKGFEVDQGDWSMLEQVQRRGKIWRDA